MILPTTDAATLFVTALSLILFGSWACTLKAAGKWRFELYAIDFALGMLLAAAVISATFGSIDGGYVETDVLILSVYDNLWVARKLNLFLALAAGALFGSGCLLLTGGVSLAGMATGSLACFGTAAMLSALIRGLMGAAVNPLWWWSGAVAAALSVFSSAAAAQLLQREKDAAKSVSSSGAGTSANGPRPTPAVRRGEGSAILKGWLLGAAAGLFFSPVYPLIEESMKTELGVGPYSAVLLCCLATVLSMPVLSLLFMNIPVEGGPLAVRNYFKAALGKHLWGVTGGAMMCAAFQCAIVVAVTPPTARLPKFVGYHAGYLGAVLAVVLGTVVWKEYSGASGRTNRTLGYSVLLFAAAIAMLCAATVTGF